MTSEQIRNTPVQAGSPQSALLLLFLREIAAQLAEVVEVLKGVNKI